MSITPVSPRARSVAAFARNSLAAALAACLGASPAIATLPDGFPVTDGLSVYLDAESVETSGSRVTTMLDRSGNENHAREIVTAEPSLPVLLESATPSGLDAVHFDGIGGFAEIPGNPADFDGRSRTIFFVFRKDAINGTSVVNSGSILSTAYTIIDSWEPEYNQPLLARHRANDIWVQAPGVLALNARNPIGDFITTRTPDGSVTEGEFHIGVQEWRDDGTLFARIRNAANETFSGDTIGAMAEPEGHLNTRIGAGSNFRNTRPTWFFEGDVAAVLIYNRDLSTSEREDVEDYLHQTYLIAGGEAGDPGAPPVTDGLIFHVNAMNVVTDGETVTQLLDLSGRDNHAIAHVHNPQPGLPTLVVGATPSGQDAVQFDGVGSVADVSSNPEDFDGRAKTTIAVFSPAYFDTADYVTTSAYEILDPTLPPEEQSPNRTWVNQIRAATDTGAHLRVGGRSASGGVVNVSTENGSLKAAGEFLIGTVHWRENGDLASVLRNADNQRFEAVTTGADAVPTGHIVTRLGGNFATGDAGSPGEGGFFEGEIAAFLIYNRELTSSELLAVEDHLFDTYFGAGPGAGGPGDPPVTDGLVLHLNGANVILGDGNAVTKLVDMSGRGNDATTHFYELPRPAPTLIPSGSPSGRPSVHFDGNLQYLEIGSRPEHFDGWGKTTMAVFKADQMDGRVVNTAYEEVGPGLAPSGRTRFGELQPWGTNNRLRANNRTATGAFIGANTPNGTLFAGEYYLGVNHAKDNGETVAILRNVANERFEGVNQGDPAAPSGHLYTRIGAGSGFGNPGVEMLFGGEVAAVVVFNRELSSSELEQVETYLYNRYMVEGDTGGYTAWIEGYDIPSHLQGPDADASGDGVANLIKYALGLDPTAPTRDGLPTLTIEADGELSYLTMNVAKNPAAADLIYLIEGSEDLTEWSADLVVVDDSDANLLRARFMKPLEHESKGFLRLRVLNEE